ncbi:hypothetical protein [Burkholderia territorii]|uniref:hypothetical protein n=1 Tax=Burkholderia territorii TaxID=1503055 RepID=UPI000AFA160A|nr:hypothetical protein [Burkholderia territorii]
MADQYMDRVVLSERNSVIYCAASVGAKTSVELGATIAGRHQPDSARQRRRITVSTYE